MMLRFLIIALFAFSQCHGDKNVGGDHEEIKKMLSDILEGQLEEIKGIHAEVEGVYKELVEKESSREEVKLLKLSDAPLPCLNLAKAAATPCPDLQEIAKQSSVVLQKTTQIVVDGFNAFNSAFRNQEFNCTATLNPFTALRCFLSAFRVAYDHLSTLKTEVLDLKNSVMTLYTEYQQYLSDCKNEKALQLKTQIVDLCKKIHSN